MLIASQAERRRIHQDFGNVVETVVVECGGCFRAIKKRCDHAVTDFQIARRHFPGWIIKGVKGAKRTRCPRCK